MASVVASVLGVERVGLDDSFVDLGGNSLAATRVVARLSSVVGVRVSVPVVFESGSVEELAARIGALVESDEPAIGGAFDMVIPLRTGDPDLESVFFVHPVVGLAWSFAELAKHVPGGGPVYGLQSPALSGTDAMPESIEEWARLYISEIRRLQSHGRFHLVGWSMGGVIAHEMAVQLQRSGEAVASLILLDTQVPAPLEAPSTCSRSPSQPCEEVWAQTYAVGTRWCRISHENWMRAPTAFRQRLLSSMESGGRSAFSRSTGRVGSREISFSWELGDRNQERVIPSSTGLRSWWARCVAMRSRCPTGS